MLQRLGGTLTAPAAGDPEAIALRYVRQALPDVDVSTLQAPTSATVSGVTMLRWPQAVDGIPSADSELRVNVTRDGRVLSVLGAPATQLPTDTTPTLTAGEAVRAVQDALGSFRTLPRTRGPAGATRRTTYDDGTSAALALLRDRLAWRVTYRESSTAVWDMFVDAESGKVLERANLVKTASGLVWDNYPGAALGGTAASVNLDPWLTSTTQLLGPSVRAFSDLDDDNVADAGEQVVPGSYAFTSMAGTGCSAAKQCSWTGAGATWTTNRQQNAVQAFYFANRFRDHLAAAPIGFDGFQGADPVIVQTDDGAATGPDSNHVNNANMYTPPDGTSPVMQMYLWRGPSYRAVNGGDDASILYHEYTHGLSNRLIRDADGAGALNSAQAGAMGEGWSDWYAKDFLVQQFPALDNPGVDGDVHMGTYTDVTPNTIRTRGLDCPVSGVAGCSGYTYGDFGEIANGPEVHYDGEIWAQTLWDLRKALGSPDAERLITQGMRLSPAEPSFLDERNAILAADTAAGGTFQAAIWTVFAKRGMGYYASTTGSDDVSPVEDFSPPPGLAEPRGTIAGRITDTSGAPLPDAKVALGSLVAEADADGRYSLPGVPARAYANLIVTAPGHDRVLTPATVAANQTTTFDPVLRRNWAARTGGATVTGGGDLAPQGCGALAAIDQHAGTAWSAPRTGSKTMTITLPQTIDVDHFAVDPGEGCADSPDAAARAVTIETSPNNATWTTAASPSFAFGDRHRMNVVTPAAGKSGVRYVRVTINSTLTAGWDYMDISEFAVYTDAPLVTPTPTPTPTPTASPQPTATPQPTVVPTPVPTVVPSPTPVAKPSFKLAASGKRSIRVTARCPKACAVTATLTVDAATARKLRTSKTLATVKRTLKAGSTAFTVKVSRKARFTKVSRIKATLTVRSGTVVERRRVTIRR